MNAYYQLFIQPLRYQSSLGKPWVFLCLIMGLGLMAGVGFVGVHANWQLSHLNLVPGVRLFFGIEAVLVPTFWASYISTSTRLNTPANANLTPGLRHRLLILTAVMWLLLSVLTTAFAITAFGHFLPVLFCVATALLVLAAMVRFSSSYLVLITAWIGIALLATSRQFPVLLKDVGHSAFWRGDVLANCLAFMVLGLAAWGLGKRLYCQGGDAHQRLYARQRKSFENQLALSRGDLKSTTAVSGIDWSKLQYGYNAALKRATSRQGSAREFLALGLGPRLHWSTTLLQLSWSVLFSGVMLLAPKLTHEFILYYIFGTTALFALIGSMNFVTVLRQTTAEQALLRLIPKLPSARQLNAVMARLSLCNFILIIVLAAGCAIAFNIAFATKGVSMQELASMTVLVITLSGVQFGLSLVDFARLGKIKQGRTTLELLGLMALGAIGAWLKYGGGPQVLFVVYVAALILAVAVFIRHRWQGLLAAPPAFPVGRMAD